MPISGRPGVGGDLPKSPTLFSNFDNPYATNVATHWVMPLWAFQDAGIQRCWGRIICLSKEDSELGKVSSRFLKEVIGDL